MLCDSSWQDLTVQSRIVLSPKPEARVSLAKNRTAESYTLSLFKIALDFIFYFSNFKFKRLRLSEPSNDIVTKDLL